MDELDVVGVGFDPDGVEALVCGGLEGGAGAREGVEHGAAFRGDEGYEPLHELQGLYGSSGVLNLRTPDHLLKVFLQIIGYLIFC